LWRKQGGPEKVATSLSSGIKAAVAAPPVAVVEAPGAVAEGPAVGTVKRLNPIKLKQLEDRLRFAEEEIPRLESSIAAAEEKLGVFTSAEESQRTAAELDRLRGERAA